MFQYNRASLKNVFFLLLVIFLGINCFVSFPPYALDDCYITYRYAYNLFHHNQLVFNLGEKILGTTTPLYTLILGGLHLFFEEIPRVSHFISFMSASLAGFFLFCLLKKDNLPVGVFCALCFPFILRDIGFEINFLIFLFALSLFLFVQGKYLICSVILGLCFLTRQDSVVFIAVMLLIYWQKNRKVPFKELLVFSITIAPWLIFSHFYFGSLFPTSFHVKGGYTNFLHYFTNSLWHLAQFCEPYNFYLLSFLSQALTELLVPADFYSNDISRISLVLCYLAWLFVQMMYYYKNVGRHRYAGALFYIYPLFMITTLSLIAPPPEHTWHLTSAIIFALIGQLNFVTRPLLLLSKRCSSSLPGKIGSRGSILLLCSYLLFLAVVNIKDFYNLAREADESFWLGARYKNYKEIANFLYKKSFDGETVFVNEVGIIGYYSKLIMMDGAGLISPHCNLYYRKGCWLMCMEQEFPDYIVARDSSIPYYDQVFDFQNNFGKMVVFKKSETLPDNDYPYLSLITICNRQNEKRRNTQQAINNYRGNYVREPTYATMCYDDVDCDGMPDDDDNCLRVPNGPRRGTCSRGVFDECIFDKDCGERGVCSTRLEDADKDLAGDVCDEDDDNDGILDDGNENGIVGDFFCKGGVTDRCDDNCPVDSNPQQEDRDNDGVGDICDNCPFAFNPDQANIDDDRKGDLCDDEVDIEKQLQEENVNPKQQTNEIISRLKEKISGCRVLS